VSSGGSGSHAAARPPRGPWCGRPGRVVRRGGSAGDDALAADGARQLPVTVAVHGDVVYVLNARDGGSIQGYRSIGSLLAPIPTWDRALGLDPKRA